MSDKDVSDFDKLWSENPEENERNLRKKTLTAKTLTVGELKRFLRQHTKHPLAWEQAKGLVYLTDNVKVSINAIIYQAIAENRNVERIQEGSHVRYELGGTRNEA